MNTAKSQNGGGFAGSLPTSPTPPPDTTRVISFILRRHELSLESEWV